MDMPTVTNPLHLRPPVWVTPSRLPIVREECSYTIQFVATDAQFYCCHHKDMVQNPVSNWQMGHSSISTQHNATYTVEDDWLWNSKETNVCFGPGNEFSPITGSDGESTEDTSVYNMYDGDECIRCQTSTFPVPQKLVLNKFSGVMTGTLDRLMNWANLRCPDNPPTKKWEEVNACLCPEGFYYDETNYGTCGTESMNVIYPYRFTIIAFNTAGFSSRTFTLPIINNWSSSRDNFVGEVAHSNDLNKFIVDGEYVDNETYLTKMKQKGYFPTEGCN